MKYSQQYRLHIQLGSECVICGLHTVQPGTAEQPWFLFLSGLVITPLGIWGNSSFHLWFFVSENSEDFDCVARQDEATPRFRSKSKSLIQLRDFVTAHALANRFQVTSTRSWCSSHSWTVLTQKSSRATACRFNDERSLNAPFCIDISFFSCCGIHRMTMRKRLYFLCFCFRSENNAGPPPKVTRSFPSPSDLWSCWPRDGIVVAGADWVARSNVQRSRVQRQSKGGTLTVSLTETNPIPVFTLWAGLGIR